MYPIKDQVHSGLLGFYKTGVSASETTRRITDFYGKLVITRQTRKWFKMFKDGRKSAKRKRGSGRPVKIDRKALQHRFFRNKDTTSYELAAGICSQPTAWRWLKKCDRKPRMQREIPHELTADQKKNRAVACHRPWNFELL
ncbi:histone-lysine N-methyltransferase SETMAR [Ditylenchus destructor]|nr:histone-lysine N-methyltransferase SETMAR [Ditylenchus destructor]